MKRYGRGHRLRRFVGSLSYSTSTEPALSTAPLGVQI